MNIISTTFFLSCLFPAAVGARKLAALQFDNRTEFEAAMVGPYLVDEFNYGPDDMDLTAAEYSDMRMSLLLSGEVVFQATSPGQTNKIWERNGDRFYCAGCNGAFQLDFRASSVRTNDRGVYGAGFFLENTIFCNQGDTDSALCQLQQVFGAAAFITYGNGDTEEIVLPESQDVFWGIADERLISTIEVRLKEGGAAFRVQIDDLIFGGGIPEDPPSDDDDDDDEDKLCKRKILFFLPRCNK